MRGVAVHFLETYAVPNAGATVGDQTLPPDFTNKFHCPLCDPDSTRTNFSSMQCFRDHIRECAAKATGNLVEGKEVQFKGDKPRALDLLNKNDGKFAYVSNALRMGLLWRGKCYARSLGFGAFVLRVFSVCLDHISMSFFCVTRKQKKVLNLCMSFRNMLWLSYDGMLCVGPALKAFMKLELPYFKIDGRTKYALATLVYMLDTLAGCSERIAFDLVHNRFCNMSGRKDGTCPSIVCVCVMVVCMWRTSVELVTFRQSRARSVRRIQRACSTRSAQGSRWKPLT